VRLAILNSCPVITRACATISAALVLRKKRARSPPAGGGKSGLSDSLVSYVFDFNPGVRVIFDSAGIDFIFLEGGAVAPSNYCVGVNCLTRCQ
jgi:hypothetical protein